MKKRLFLLVALWIVALLVGVRSYRQVSARRGADKVCAAVERGDLTAALEGSEALVGIDAPGLRVAECRAKALIGLGDFEGAARALDGVLSDPEARDWLPDPFLVVTTVAQRRLVGRLPEATELVRRGTARYPESRELVLQEVEVRSEVENEETVLEEIAQRVLSRGTGQSAGHGTGGHGTNGHSTTGFFLARKLIDRDRLDLADTLLGVDPPVGNPQLMTSWFKLRTLFYSRQGNSEKIDSNRRQWVEAGGQDAEARLYEAVYRSIYQIIDPRNPILPMLRAVAERQAEITDRGMILTLYQRLISTLVSLGQNDEALAIYDEAKREFNFPPGSREEILRAITQEDPSRTPRIRLGRVHFILDTEILDTGILDTASSNPVLWVSPEPALPVDTEFEPHDLSTGEARVERSLGEAPLRWVVRQGDQKESQTAPAQVLASGTVWPTESSVVEVRIAPRIPHPAPRASLPAQAPADGQRRVILVILDCADWRLIQYLRARLELPVMDGMIRQGRRGVLSSDPPFTAAALRSLVFPQTDVVVSTLETVHRLGLELAGNTFVENNPMAFLGWLLPESTTLFETLGAGDHVAVNFLHAVGSMGAGNHGERIGPRGRVGRFTEWKLKRRLQPGELELPGAESDQQGYGGFLLTWFEEIAALFDASGEIARTPEIDLALLRVAPLDLATHHGYAGMMTTGQDDASHPIYAVYRYIDRRLGELYGQLDGDDILVVMSDHGIKNSAEHDPRCFFVAVGGEVTPGRIAGTPQLRGVASMLADLLDVPTSWPRTGVEAWVEELP